ncbi:putative flavin carrier protein 3 [Exophiala xenobiotica]|uniref:Flavin carrier protein 3 n=1 Tax=Vermiconidia calcicola TaxID=1690605 RepID=A0AAV9Q1W6_9PEZI|nr:putative flavin carrier protein 3 [Exophiala xenobiotica]KAK5533463.1 putative flavin carrier protein 3 [Vermiconidia calcicola]KAK5542924.1 putative flavin carrier protein 3 [Chaetothyriales sp. CCFEE 6169]KAK5296452.1 putative flavin carrier protein 3 [Exophiala xenobiotica]KAK5334505.1 putative flavin carrier protein 3 [Exophiala xenobiotica]
MRPQTSFRYLLSLLAALSLSSLAFAEDVIESNSLNSCQSGSNFTATLFNVAYTPKNNSITVNINGVSSITGNVTAQLEVIAYGFTILNDTIDPCADNLAGFCPMQTGQINIETNIAVPSDVSSQVPGIAYSVPDLDGVVRVYVTSLDTNQVIACMEADLSNRKSVYQPAVGWATAVIAGAGLVAAGVTSGLGHPNTAAHVAANAVSLFGFFQAQAIIGMTSVTMPPIVQSWTQNFQWSMGIIRIGFLQNIATWYQRATGGTPTTYLSTLSTISVQVQKRAVAVKRSLSSMAAVASYASRGARYLAKRADTTTTVANTKIVRGIDRVGFRAGIEQTNIFMTGLIFFIFILFMTAILVALTKAILDGCAKAGWMKSDKFLEFRNGWKIVIKGILFRLVLLGFVQMSVLCLWELVERDSAAEVVLALVVFISMAAALGWASFKVIQLAKKSVTMHKNPAYILYSDPQCLNKWGFLYVQYRATAYYFVVAVLCYIVAKAVFIAFAQKSPVAQAIGLVVVEAVALIGVSVIRPFMDKKTNVFNISIASVNFLNAIFLLVFSDAFGQPEMVSGVMGVIFALYNVIFAAVLLIMVLVASIYAIASKNPEVRYQPMRDDRGSFIKSQAALTTELDALGATARGENEPKTGYKNYEDDDSFSSESLKHQSDVSHRPMSQNRGVYGQQETPMYPSENNGRRGPPQSYEQRQMYSQGYSHSGDQGYPSRPTTSPNYQYSDSVSNVSSGYAPPRSAGGYAPQQGFRAQNNASPWQRGAGYD